MIPFAAQLNNLEQYPWFRSAHRWIIPRAKFVTKLLQTYAVLVFLPVLAGAFVMWQGTIPYYPFFDRLARQLGEISVLLYSFTLIPGMLRRFGVFPLTRSVLMIWRRYLGIAMFDSAIAHMMLIFVVPVVGIDPALLLKDPGIHVLYGLSGLLLLLPLWLTSNDVSVKRLGKTWHTIHALTYIALFAIFLHVYLGTAGWARIVISGVFFVEALSWLVRWIDWLKPTTPPPAAGIPPTAPATSTP